MKSLGPLPLNTLPYYTAIAAGKHEPRRQRLQNLVSFVAGRYVAYSLNTQNLASIAVTGCTHQEKDDLIHCYDSSSRALNSLKLAIGTHHNSTCPDVAALCQYCGLAYDPSQFDHYLPKEYYPEFSTLSLNLVPCCGQCNGLKGTAWLDANGARRIVNFYYDTLPDRRFLFADIEVTEGLKAIPIAHFRLSADPASYCGLRTTIESHFEKLELLDRYRRAAYAQFSDIKEEFGPIVQLLGVAVVAQMLEKKAQNLSESRSPNYWEVALLFGMASSGEYLNSL